MERQLKYPRRKNIRDLPGKAMMEVSTALDTRAIDNVSAWRAFAARLKGHYSFKAQDVERFALQSQGGSSPSNQMLLELGAKAMDTETLVEVLSDLKLEDVLTHFVEYEGVKIILQPSSYIKVKEGQQIVVSTKATGFPYPRFLWYHFDTKLNESVATSFTESDLVIHRARLDHSGDYCCLVYNRNDTGIFTKWCSVTVQSASPTETISSAKEAPSPVIAPLTPGPYKADQVQVYTLPVIVQQPWTLSVNLGSPFCLTCEARGHLPLKYQWLRNTEPVSSTQTGYLKVECAKAEDDGVYQCVVSNEFGSARSDCVKVGVVTSEWECFSPAPLIPEIQEHPKSCQVQLGGHAIFRCIAHGKGPLHYQWFKDCDSIPGATESEYKVYNINHQSMQGSYMCLVSNNHNGQVLSKGAVLQIGEFSYKHNHIATDKLALLIGNYDYRSQQPLKAPQTDIQNLSTIFQRVLGFKVVSLLNLTLTEMISAVEEFCELIDSGVYCVFYFCGHGFDENNHSYILPNDVPTDYKTEECLSAEYVLSRMQLRRPKVCCMILDICRKPPENPSQGQRTAIMEQTPVEDGNTVVCYATSCGLAAFEFRPQSKGILVTHLEKLLPQPISIEEVFRRVKEAVGNDARVNQNARTRQIPEVRSNLIDVHRSFTDPIETSGHTRACNKRQLAWENAHVKPPPMEVCLQPVDLGVVVQLTFQHEFSNVLNVYVKVISKGNLSDCIAWISKLPSSVSMMKKPTCVTPEGSEFTMTKNVIIDIQKLKENLRVSLGMRYRLPGRYDYEISKDTQIDLQLPLVAGLKLWSPRPVQSSFRHAVEQTEEEKSDA
ncbi:mucosa-associated lymphoid tissue lymphoma translocation protein 1-like [Babylonia areolata]|uniref:mucosa-associated lymphoid tissue lymphoma translocation protein 1-like n=1 Tax=Babylonia areolata TaxID=304850 RepID=UPI003FCFF959